MGPYVGSSDSLRTGCRFMPDFGERSQTLTLHGNSRRLELFVCPVFMLQMAMLRDLASLLLEAEASGVPVVTSAMGGATEGIHDGVTGFAFEERDVDTLASRLITMLTDDAVATSMALAGPRFVSDKFDLYRCAERLELLYDLTSATSSE